MVLEFLGFKRRDGSVGDTFHQGAKRQIIINQQSNIHEVLHVASIEAYANPGVEVFGKFQDRTVSITYSGNIFNIRYFGIDGEVNIDVPEEDFDTSRIYEELRDNYSALGQHESQTIVSDVHTEAIRHMEAFIAEQLRDVPLDVTPIEFLPDHVTLYIVHPDDAKAAAEAFVQNSRVKAKEVFAKYAVVEIGGTKIGLVIAEANYFDKISLLRKMAGYMGAYVYDRRDGVINQKISSFGTVNDHDAILERAQEAFAERDKLLGEGKNPISGLPVSEDPYHPVAHADVVRLVTPA